MSNFYKNNDDFLRDKLNNHEFDAVPGAWENMSKMLNQQKMIHSGGSSSLWWSIPTFSAVILTAIIGTGIYIKSNQNKQVASTITTEKKAIALATTKDKDQNHLTSNNNTVSRTTDSDVLTNASSTNPKEQNLSTAVVSNDKTDASAINSQDFSPASEEEQLFEGLHESSDYIAPVTTSNYNESVVKSSATSINDKRSDTKIASDADIAVFRAYLNQNTQPIQTNYTNTTEAEKDTENEDNTAIKSNDNTTKNNVEDVVQKPSGKRSRTVIINQFSHSTFLKKQKVTKIKDNTEPVNFGIKTALTDPNRCPLKFSLYAGINTQLMMQVNEFSFSPVAGIATTYKFAPRHSLRLGIQYKGISRKDNQADMENSEMRYDSGLNSAKSYLLKRLDLLEVPLSYQFYFSRHFNLTTGLKCSWIINHESSNPAFNQMSLPQLGLSNFEVGLLLGLEFNINKHFSLAIQYNQGLINMSGLGQKKEQQMMQDEADMGINSIEKQHALTNEGEIAVPVETTTNQQQFVRLPYQLYNNDIMLLLRYTF